MHFHKRYIKLVEYYQNNFSEHGEWHHIIPKCIGGTNDSSNLVFLPYKAHFICHWLLTKIYPDNRKLKHAFSMMCVVNPYQERRCSAAHYELARKNRRSALKNLPRSEETKQKLRKPKSNKENYKKPKSTEHKMNIGKAHKGRKHHWHQKIVNSRGYKLYHQNRTNVRLKNQKFHRENFSALKVSRKEYYSMFPELSSSTLKRYLRSL